MTLPSSLLDLKRSFLEKLISAIGPQLAANSLSVVPASDAVFAVAGGLAPSTRSVAVTGAITSADGVVFADATGGDVTLTLPTAVGRAGAFQIKCINAVGGHVTIASAGGNVEGAATYVMAYRESVMIYSDGANWWIL